MSHNRNIFVLGAWHLGSVFSIGLSDKHNVKVWDQRSDIQKQWLTPKVPIFEPGLDELFSKNLNKSLFWSLDFNKDVKNADWILITYDTPVDEEDRLIMEPVIEGFQLLDQAGPGEKTNILILSQLPIGTSRAFETQLRTRHPDWKGQLVCSPENLRLGDGLNSLRQPDRIVYGVKNTDQSQCVIDLSNTLGYENVPHNIMNYESAEMVKHALNAYLATCVVFANEISNVCEQNGANAHEVLKSLKQDSRVSAKAPLGPGLGFAGGTLARDVRILSEKTQSPNLFETLYKINSARNNWVVNQIENKIGTLKDKKILVLGLTYKAGTSTLRRSPGLDLARKLKKQGAIVVSADPKADLNEMLIEDKGLITEFARDAESLIKDSEAAVIMTEWPDFAHINWQVQSMKMKSPLLIDMKGIIKTDPQNLNVVRPGYPI